MPELTLQSLIDDPSRITRPLVLPGGENGLARLLTRADGERLAAYLEGLSAATRRLYAPHPFDHATGLRLCDEIDYRQSLRFVCQIGADPEARAGDAGGTRLIAYFIVGLGPGASQAQHYAQLGISLDPATTCWLAPSVADEYQSRGVGSLLLPVVLDVMRQLGMERMVLSGGTRAENHRAIHFYAKHGFRRVGDFDSRGADGVTTANHDMILALV